LNLYPTRYGSFPVFRLCSYLETKLKHFQII
jgi:hypothetical protein